MCLSLALSCGVQPYFQPNPVPPAPFITNTAYKDPAFGPGAAWALTVSNSQNILVYGACTDVSPLLSYQQASITCSCSPRAGAGLYSFFQVRTGLAPGPTSTVQHTDVNVSRTELRPRLPEHVQLPAAEREHRLELVDRNLHALHRRLAVHAQRERPGHRPELGEQERLRANTHLVDPRMTSVGLLSRTLVGSRGEGLRIHKASERWNRGRAGGCSLVCITMYIVDGRRRNLKSWNGSGGGGIVRLMLTYEYSRVSLGFSWVCNLVINGDTKCARMLGEQFMLCHCCNCSNR